MHKKIEIKTGRVFKDKSWPGIKIGEDQKLSAKLDEYKRKFFRPEIYKSKELITRAVEADLEMLSSNFRQVCSTGATLLEIHLKNLDLYHDLKGVLTPDLKKQIISAVYNAKVKHGDFITLNLPALIK